MVVHRIEDKLEGKSLIYSKDVSVSVCDGAWGPDPIEEDPLRKFL